MRREVLRRLSNRPTPRRPDVYVSGDLLIYHEEGNPRASTAEAQVAELEALLGLRRG